MATFMLSAIVQKVTGQKLTEYLQTRLFGPLAITGYKWDESPEGINVGGWGLYIKTEDMAKFGQLFLQKGVWNGEQLLPPGWVEEASSWKIVSGPAGNETYQNPESDWTQGYCYQMWRCRHNAYRADGANGQFIIVIPDSDAVVAMTANVRDMQAEINLVWKHILPALKQ
jgi:CubicO group peptidase (beta-lactamase class C family)